MLEPPRRRAAAPPRRRAAATLAGRRYATARPATIRRHLINLAGRIARHARGVTIHLPATLALATLHGSDCSPTHTHHQC